MIPVLFTMSKQYMKSAGTSANFAFYKALSEKCTLGKAYIAPSISEQEVFYISLNVAVNNCALSFIPDIIPSLS